MMVEIVHKMFKDINRAWRKEILGQKLSGRPKGSKNKKKVGRS